MNFSKSKVTPKKIAIFLVGCIAIIFILRVIAYLLPLLFNVFGFILGFVCILIILVILLFGKKD